MRLRDSVLLVLALAWAYPIQAARHWLYSAAKQEWNTGDNKFTVDSWAWGDPPDNTQKLICTELKATPDECYIRWVDASYDTTGMTEIFPKGDGDDYYIDMLEEVTFTAGGTNLAQGSWAPRTKDSTWKWLHLIDADADGQGLPRGMLMVPAVYDTSSYIEDSEASSAWEVNDIPFGQYNNRGKENPNFPPGVNVTVAPWAGVREQPASVTYFGTANGPDETDGSITWSHNTTGLGTDGSMYVGVFSAASASGDRNVTSVTFNGDNLTEAVFIDRNPKNSHLSIWYEHFPDVGNYSVVVNRGCSGTCFVFVATSMVYEGVDIFGAVAADSGFGSGTTASADVVVSPEANSASAEMNVYWNTPNQSAGSGQTVARNFPDSGPGINVVWGYETGLSVTTHTQQWTWTGSEDWIMVAAEVPAGAAAGQPFHLRGELVPGMHGRQPGGIR